MEYLGVWDKSLGKKGLNFNLVRGGSNDVNIIRTSPARGLIIKLGGGEYYFLTPKKET